MYNGVFEFYHSNIDYWPVCGHIFFVFFQLWPITVNGLYFFLFLKKKKKFKFFFCWKKFFLKTLAFYLRVKIFHFIPFFIPFRRNEPLTVYLKLIYAIFFITELFRYKKTSKNARFLFHFDARSGF